MTEFSNKCQQKALSFLRGEALSKDEQPALLVNVFNEIDSNVLVYRLDKRVYLGRYNEEVKTCYDRLQKDLADIPSKMFEHGHVQRHIALSNREVIQERLAFAGEILRCIGNAVYDTSKIKEDDEFKMIVFGNGMEGQKAVIQNVEIKPTIKREAVPIVFDILKDFFSLEQQSSLLQILKTADDAAEPLIFSDNGSRLADAFKQLYDSDFITGCQKKELQRWIEKNFKYTYRGTIKIFKLRYLEDIISTNKDKCQRPILNVTKVKATGQYVISKA